MKPKLAIAAELTACQRVIVGICGALFFSGFPLGIRHNLVHGPSTLSVALFLIELFCLSVAMPLFWSAAVRNGFPEWMIPVYGEDNLRKYVREAKRLMSRCNDRNRVPD